ncbi:MAG: sigma-70 family RNA polymerase sigma factor [Deltaproteobacteria bacterium]|nr:sigma-70 family RNA polymerase sigma factor [Deltaproteobacteria bacterium]
MWKIATESEFEEIVHSTKNIVLSAISRNLHPSLYRCIDDVVQETYLRAYKSLVKGKFRGDSTLETWIYTIARNESLRMNSKNRRIYLPDFEMEAGVAFEYESIGLEKAMDKIPDKYREVLLLRMEGFSEEEISSRLEISTGTVKSRAFRGREMLGKILGVEQL